MIESRFRRRQSGVAGLALPGDAHAERESRFLKMRECSRTRVRDNAAARLLIERAVERTRLRLFSTRGGGNHL